MDSLSILKQWRASTTKQSRSTTTTTIASTILQEDDDGDGDDEGPFIDLEFSVPDEDADKNSDDDDPAALRADSNLSLSPSDDLFFKGRLLPSETSSLVFSTSESNPKPQFPVSLLKSKFRVFMLGSKKTKTSISDISGASASPKHQQHNINNSSSSSSNKLFVRFKVEEVPLVSLFTRDNSFKSSKLHSENGDTVATEDKKFSKEVLQRYLSKIKRLRFSGQLGSVPSVSKPGSDGNPPAGLKPVHRRLGKSRSASATVAAVRSPPRRRDDSLLQQQDGIQSAIAHCKRSFNADKEPEPSLVRSNSDPGNGRPETLNEGEAKEVDLH